MKKQSTQVIALVGLLVAWAVLWQLFVKNPRTVAVPPKQAAVKSAPTESLLVQRFHRVEAEMDALYRDRTKAPPVAPQFNPFRIPAGMEMLSESESPGARRSTKTAQADAESIGPVTPDIAANVLKNAIANLRFGGVVTLNGAIKVTIDGQIHKEGDVFSTRLPNSKGQPRTVILIIRHLSAASATIALAEPEAGGAEIRVRLN